MLFVGRSRRLEDRFQVLVAISLRKCIFSVKHLQLRGHIKIILGYRLAHDFFEYLFTLDKKDIVKNDYESYSFSDLEMDRILCDSSFILPSPTLVVILS